VCHKKLGSKGTEVPAGAQEEKERCESSEGWGQTWVKNQAWHRVSRGRGMLGWGSKLSEAQLLGQFGLRFEGKAHRALTDSRSKEDPHMTPMSFIQLTVGAPLPLAMTPHTPPGAKARAALVQQ